MQETILLYLNGIFVSLSLLISVFLLSFVIASLFTTVYLTQRRILQRIINIYIYLVRGTPLLVQLFLLYYGLAQFEGVRESIFWSVLQNPFGCALIALSMNTIAYTTVIFKGAIVRVPNGPIEAARALGLSAAQRLKAIILPIAMRLALPSYCNEIIYILKATALASTISLLDILGTSDLMVARTYQIAPYYLIAASLYLMINAVMVMGFHRLKHKYNIGS